MEYKIKEDVLQATVNYLAKQPYADVANLLQILLKLPKVEPLDPPENVKSITK